MEIINRRQRMSSVARKLRRDDKTIGLVPTMGALHEGHLSLVREARRMCDVVIVSVFVNPAQFGPGEDFERYPRDLASDAAKLTDYNVDYIFAPSTDEIYPKNFSTYVTVENISDQLEGSVRPGHFRGVATVLTILFNVIRPEFAFFGQKDAQQTLVVKRMVRDLSIDTEIVVLPTIREDSGLALSSRNAYLSEDEHDAAAVLRRALSKAEAAYDEGERSAKRLYELVRSEIEKEPLARLQYISINDQETLEKVDKLDERPAIISLAAFFGKTRLIDNVVLSQSTRQKTRVPVEM